MLNDCGCQPSPIYSHATIASYGSWHQKYEDEVPGLRFEGPPTLSRALCEFNRTYT